ncbi:MAG: hypothetical protein ACM3KM_00200 [Acidobacteriaceae bacterium]
MQEINLLQSKLKDRTESWERKNFLVTGFFAVLAVAVLAAGGIFMFMNKSTKSEIDRVKTENNRISTELKSTQGEMASAKSLQAQFDNINRLLKDHVYWIPLLDIMQAGTTKKTQYTLLSSTVDGKVHIEGLVDNMDELAKLVYSLSTNKDLLNVKLLSFNLSQDMLVRYKYAIEFEFKDILSYKGN